MSPITSVDNLTRPDESIDSAALGGRSRRRTWTLVVACAGVVLVIASMVALNTALGDIAVGTSATQTQLTWVVDGYTLVLACLLLPAGALGDRYGRREALLIGLAIFTAASIAPIFLDSPVQIIVARAVAGMGAAFVMPATLSLLTAAYPKQDRAKAVGIWAGVAGSGATLGMLGSGVLLHFWAWQSIFWALAASAALLFALTCTVSSSRDSDAPPVDLPGAVLIGAAVAIFVFGILEAPSHGWSDPLVYGCLAGGLGLGLIFGVVELRRRRPLLDVRLFGNPEFAVGAATITVFFAANFGYMYLVMQHFQLILGYSAIHTAIALSPLMAGIIGLSALSFWYVPRLGLRMVLFVGLVVLSAGFFLLSGLDIESTYGDVVWPLVVLSVGIGLLTAPASAAIMNTVPDDKQGVASAVNDAAREIGAALGIAIAGSILAARYSDRLLAELSPFPANVRGPASESLAQALNVSNAIGPQGQQLAEISKVAFLHAMHPALMVVGIIVAVSAVLIGLWAPGRDGQQLGIVRRLLSRDG